MYKQHRYITNYSGIAITNTVSKLSERVIRGLIEAQCNELEWKEQHEQWEIV